MLKSMLLNTLRGASSIQRYFVAVLAANVGLLLLGPFVAPSSFTSADGWEALLGAISMQVALAFLALIGPLSFAQYPRTMGISLGLGALFATVYLGFLARDFAGVSWGPDDSSILLYSLFVGIALMAGALASAHSQRLRDGVVAAIWALLIGTAIWSLGVLLLNYTLWGSAHWYHFWLQDGAVDDFHRSGGHDLNAFLLQDLHGALFFHQILSAVIGALGGLVGSVVALGGARLWYRVRRPVSTPA
jgi:hypothetical protein